MIAQTPNIINKRILQIAVPSIISNITVPLLGLIDVTIVGHLGSAAYIGAIAVGGMLFNIIYWIFGFLRMGTSGMTSQAYGKHDMDEVTRLLLRSVGVGLLIAIILVALQYPIRKLAFTFIQTTEEVEQLLHSISKFVFGELLPCWAFTVLPVGSLVCRIRVSQCTLPLHKTL